MLRRPFILLAMLATVIGVASCACPEATVARTVKYPTCRHVTVKMSPHEASVLDELMQRQQRKRSGVGRCNFWFNNRPARYLYSACRATPKGRELLKIMSRRGNRGAACLAGLQRYMTQAYKCCWRARKAGKTEPRRRATCPPGSVRRCLSPTTCVCACPRGTKWDDQQRTCRKPTTEELAAKRSKAEKYLAYTRQEVKTGRCTPQRYQSLRRAMRHLKGYFHRMTSRTRYPLAEHKIVVAKPGGTPLTMTTYLGAEHHVLVVGVHPVKLEVKDGNGYAVNGASFLARLTRRIMGLTSIHNRKQVAAVAVTTNAGEKLSVTVTGKGCTLVLLFRKFP